MQLSALQRTVEPRLTAAVEQFAASVREGLLDPGRKRLSPEYFYDEVGSALFEAITVLPEYGLTRADSRILRHHSADIAGLVPAPVSVLELGSGSGTKTAHILRSLSLRQGSVDYFPIDVSGSALDHCQHELSPLARVHPVRATFVTGLRSALARLTAGHSALLLFLGSTIGNFDGAAALELLGQLRAELSDRDMLLLGTDLVKPEDLLLSAYDDPAGVTAAFNRNLLARINRELEANFDLRKFRHEARYNRAEQRIEMHLVSTMEQEIEIRHAGCRVSFRKGESIWTEASYKYELRDLVEMAGRSGFRAVETWTDEEWPFAESLWATS